MYWNLQSSRGEHRRDFKSQGRFVLHKHHDSDGAHLDLRIEEEGHLEGWRIDASDLEGNTFATQKARHPKRWLDQGGDALRVDEGEYQWKSRDEHGGTLMLQGRDGSWRVDVTRDVGITPVIAHEIRGVLRENNTDALHAPGLIHDGLTARRHAIERLCGLGAILDGDAFDEKLWRRTLEGLRLDELHQQLRSFELRFDCAFPAQPVSRPESLNDETLKSRSDHALEIVRG